MVKSLQEKFFKRGIMVCNTRKVDTNEKLGEFIPNTYFGTWV